MPSTITISDLPDVLPIFPLPRVILLPRASLPLNIFEPRYVAMVDDAFKTGRLIGIIQQKKDADIYDTGCAGRIVSYAETDDGRYLITLKGICRFTVKKELDLSAGGYRQVVPDWTGFATDFTPETGDAVCRDTLAKTLRTYFDKMNLFCDQWDNMQDMCCDRLVATLGVVCPLEPDEKQSLVEAKTLKERADLLKEHLDRASLRATEKTGVTICH